MKGKKASVALAAIIGFGAVASLCACGGSGGSGEIDFWYSASVPDGRIISEMIDAYNNGQGKEDGVHVTGDNRGSVSRTDLMVNSPNVIMLSDEQFKQFAVEDYYLDLTQYYEEMPGNYREEEIPTSFTRAFRIDTKDDANGKRMAGEGAAIQGIPFGVDPMIYYYSKNVFEEAGIKIISCEEKDLASKYPGLQPHGYAEYSAENGANPPVEGATVSENLAGESVYKIFNNLIPMNFEEFRYLSKCFTKSYTDNDSTTDYGSATHHWFSFGWSVGGDCVGYDGEKYSFTALDSSANYLVTAKDGVTVNGKHYAAGEVVRYEDKVKQADIAAMSGLHPLPSQETAMKEFINLSVPRDKTGGMVATGYGVATAINESVDALYSASNKVAMVSGRIVQTTTLEVAYKGQYDIALPTQWREYKGGSVYYKGEETFKNEYLKVIGKQYDGTVYTGELDKDAESGVPFVGRQTGYGSFSALMIPVNSDSSNYEAAWKFIRWAASEEGQRIYMKTGNVPNQSALALSDEYAAIGSGRNYRAAAIAAQGAEIGDWAYFNNGAWVDKWSGNFNQALRLGYTTPEKFMQDFGGIANTDIGKVSIVMNGRW